MLNCTCAKHRMYEYAYFCKVAYSSIKILFFCVKLVLNVMYLKENFKVICEFHPNQALCDKTKIWQWEMWLAYKFLLMVFYGALCSNYRACLVLLLSKIPFNQIVTLQSKCNVMTFWEHFILAITIPIFAKYFCLF